jgi:hypothetical protein
MFALPLLLVLGAMPPCYGPAEALRDLSQGASMIKRPNPPSITARAAFLGTSDEVSFVVQNVSSETVSISARPIIGVMELADSGKLEDIGVHQPMEEAQDPLPSSVIQVRPGEGRAFSVQASRAVTKQKKVFVVAAFYEVCGNTYPKGTWFGLLRAPLDSP